MEINNLGPKVIGTVQTTAPAGAADQTAPVEEGPPPAPVTETAPSVKLDWQPIDVDLSKVDVNVPAPPMWSYGDKPVAGRTFTSWGDPHEISGDGLHFDNEERGEFIKLMSASGDFMVQTRQDPWVKNSAATVNTAAAVKLGDDLVVYDFNTKSLTINGEETSMDPAREIALPGGGKVTTGPDGIQMVSPKGDRLNLEFKDTYMNLTGEIGPGRKDGEVRGELGNFDADDTGSDDMIGRDGKKFGDPGNKDHVKAFLEEWRASEGESLFSRSEDLNFYKTYVADGKGEKLGTMWEHLLKYYDLNGDGSLGQQEYLIAKAARRTMYITDENGNGVVEGKEFINDKKLERFDKNKDGKLSASEYFLNSMGWDILRELRIDMENAQKKKDAEKAAAAGKVGAPQAKAAIPFPPPKTN